MATATVAVNPYKAGDIVHTSWGWEQTNVDFYVVTRVTAARVWVREIAKDYRETHFMAGKTWPVEPVEMIGPETRHNLVRGGFTIDGHYTGPTTGEVDCSSYA